MRLPLPAFWMVNILFPVAAQEEFGLMKRLDYGRNLSRQFPVPRYRVIYPKSAMYCTAAVVSNDHFQEAVVDQQLYWGQAATLGEARYLAAVLNAPVVTTEVRKMQPRAEHNPRDLAQYVFKLPIPAFDPGRAAHQELAELAAQAESVAAAVDLPPVKFEAQRRRVRRALEESGVEGRIDAIVSALLERAAFPDDHRRLIAAVSYSERRTGKDSACFKLAEKHITYGSDPMLAGHQAKRSTAPIRRYTGDRRSDHYPSAV